MKVICCNSCGEDLGLVDKVQAWKNIYFICEACRESWVKVNEYLTQTGQTTQVIDAVQQRNEKTENS